MSARRGGFAGLVVAAGVLGARLATGTAGGAVQTADGVSEVRAWLGWQLWDNVAAGRPPLDASVFVDGPASLVAITGNPGAAALSALLHAALPPAAAGTVALALVLGLNAVAGGVYGARVGLPWLGALAASAAWWGAVAQSGGAAQGLLAPGLLAALAWQDGRRPLAVALAAVGALVAPAPTLGALLGGGAAPLAALAALGLAAPAFGTTAGPALAPGDLAWPLGRASVAAPLAAWAALVGLWGARSRPLAALAAVALAAALTPAAVAGFAVRGAGALGAAPAAFALALLLAAALPLAARAWPHGRRVLFGAVLLADAAAPLALGAGAAGAPLPPPPPGLVALAEGPRRSEVLVLPAEASPAVGVGWISAHRQLAGVAPVLGVQRPTPAPAAVADHVRRSPRPVVLVWLAADGATASALASAFGPPASVDATAAVWR